MLIMNQHLKLNLNQIYKSNIDMINQEKDDKKINQIEEGNNEIIENDENIIKLYKKDPLELNKLGFEDAIIYDNRTIIQIYINYLQKGHIIINTFITKCYFKLRIIKIIFFIFYLFLYFSSMPFFILTIM